MLHLRTTACAALFLAISFLLQASRLLGQAPAAPQASNKPSAEEVAPKQRSMYAARYLPATDLAKAMSAFFQDVPHEALSVSAEPITNRLLISGQRDRVAEVLSFLDALDRQPEMLAIDIWIVELKQPAADANALSFSGPLEKILPQLVELQKAEKLAIANHIQLGGASNQPMSVQQGERRPFVRGSQITAGGRQSSVTFENVGTVVGVTARVTPNGEIVAQFDVNKSFPAPQEQAAVAPGVARVEERRPESSLTITCQTTTTIRDGHATTLSGISSNSSSPEVRIVAAARIVDPDATPGRK